MISIIPSSATVKGDLAIFVVFIAILLKKAEAWGTSVASIASSDGTELDPRRLGKPTDLTL